MEGWKLARNGRKPINRKLEWKNRQQRLNNCRHFFLKTNSEGVEIDEKAAEERFGSILLEIRYIGCQPEKKELLH